MGCSYHHMTRLMLRCFDASVLAHTAICNVKAPGCVRWVLVVRSYVVSALPFFAAVFWTRRFSLSSTEGADDASSASFGLRVLPNPCVAVVHKGRCMHNNVARMFSAVT